MNEHTQALYERLNHGPAVLFLGQNYLRLETGNDPFLSEVVRKYGKQTGEEPRYDDILGGEAQEAIEDSLAWMQARCERLSVPPWLTTVAELAWSGVYTSAIDVVWPKAFRSDWRELQAVRQEKFNFSDPRNRSRLHCTYLFGSVDQDDVMERPPLSKREWYKRKQTALTLARRLPELITPFGVLILEGYDGNEDWFSLADLLSLVADELGPGQVHVFSSRRDTVYDSYAQLLINDRHLTLHEESLASFLVRGESSGLVRLGPRPMERLHARHIRLEDMTLSVPTSLWNLVARSAIILDDAVSAPPKPLSADMLYREFRQFLSESGASPKWSGFAYGFAFRRNFETHLRVAVDKRLRLRVLESEPILVQGQTGTGKTVALARLAYEIRQEGKYPVLFLEGGTRRPINSDIDAFCQWVKSEWEAASKPGAPTILIVWDANEDDQYYPLSKYLAGRGHRVVLVGSSYRQNARRKARARGSSKQKLVGTGVVAESHLTGNEVEDFEKFLDRFEPTLGRQLQRHISSKDNSFLVALYRLLPPTRSLIRTGVIREFDRTEKLLASLVQGRQGDDEASWSPQVQSSLAFALMEAGLIGQSDLLGVETTVIAGEEVSDIQRLMGLVMVPGSLGLRIPFELLLRTIGHEGMNLIFSDLLGKFDIFQWHEDRTGNITIGPRHSLEAKLWTRTNLGGPKYEVEYACQLLFAVNDTGYMFENREVQFAVDLVRNMGPNNQDRSRRYHPYFIDLANTLTKLREERSIENPRIILQEAMLLREFVREESQSGNPPRESESLLEKAEVILNRALELIDGKSKSRAVFLSELASLLGTRFLHLIRSEPLSELALDGFERSRQVALRAWSMDSDNFIPIDILSWTTSAVLERPADELSDEYRHEIQADILHVFDMAEAHDFGGVQEESFQLRRMKIGGLIGDVEMSDEAFQRLIDTGSSAGYYLRARNILGQIPSDRVLTSEQQHRCVETMQYLDENQEEIGEDARCLHLKLKLLWMVKNGRPIFVGERQVVRFDYQDWQHCDQLIGRLLVLDDIYQTASLTFVRGLCAFHLGDVKESFDIFRQLERDTDESIGPRRIIRSYLAGDATGKPRQFSGEVRSVSEDSLKGEVWVPDIRSVVPFRPRDFNQPNIIKGTALSEFHLAFNYLGPIADPVGKFRPSKVVR